MNLMKQQLRLLLVTSAACCIATMANAAIVTDTFSRQLTGEWGAVDNASVNGDTGTVAADYTLDGDGSVNGSAGSFSNSRIVLDYNLATDPAVIAGGGFVVEWRVNPGDGDDANGETGTGREFAGIALSDSNSNPPYGGAGAITNGSNTTLRYALLPRNSGSAGYLTRTAGNVRTLVANGNPLDAVGFNETVFDPVVFADYSTNGAPDPYENDQFYDVRMVVLGDFSAGSSVTVIPSVNGVPIPPQVIEWGTGGQAYLSAIAFNGPHQYDDLRISAVPEPAASLMAAAAVGVLGAVAVRRRKA